MFSNLDLNNEHAPGPGGDAGPVSGGTSPENRPENRRDTDVFDYEDYRAYMRDRFAELQARNVAFSQRGLARKAGIANPGFFNEVIRGRRRLSPAAAAKMAIGLELSPMETAYFSALVDYTEARDPVAKIRSGRLMLALKNRRLFQTIQGMPSRTETLRQLMLELERDWVLLAAGLGEDQAPPEGGEPVLDPMGESPLRRILERLVCLRTQPGAAPQRLHLSLSVAPRIAAPFSTPSS